MRMRLAAAALCGLAYAGPACAAPIFDTSLAAPGVYVGNTTNNDHYTVNTTGGTELGITTVQRFIGNYTPDAGTSTYRVPLGNTQVAGQAGSVWGFIFSLNNGPSGPTLSQITTALTVFDVANNNTFTFDPRNFAPVGYGPAGRDSTAVLSRDYAFQNSYALSYRNGVANSLDPLYSSTQDNTFVITFSADCTAACAGGARSLGSVQETVIAGNGVSTTVPEPASLALLGAGLVGAGMARRRREG